MSKEYARIRLKIKDLYEKSAKKFGDSPRGVGWKDKVSHNLRLRMISEVGICNGCSVLDVGCGYGALYRYLIDSGLTKVNYTGIDIVEDLITMARRRFGDQAEFRVADIMSVRQKHDYVVNLGIFNVKLDYSDRQFFRNYVTPMIHKMWKLAKVGLVATFMTDKVDYRNFNLYYANPSEILEFFRGELSRYVALRHDYALYEFAAYAFREGKT